MNGSAFPEYDPKDEEQVKRQLRYENIGIPIYVAASILLVAFLAFQIALCCIYHRP